MTMKPDESAAPLRRLTEAEKDAVRREAGPHRTVNFHIARATTKGGKERYICCYRAEVQR